MTNNVLVTVGIIYYRPGHYPLLQEFIWQTPDVAPQLSRVRRFLMYWQQNIEATIKDVEISVSDSLNRTYRSMDLNAYLKME